jgi:threonine 3-dehydrogenase
MKAVVKTREAPGAELLDVDLPDIGPKDVLVKVKAAAICGSDINIYCWNSYAQGRVKPPLIFGHEMCGEVIETGKQVIHIKRGDIVAVETHIPCGACYQCQTGAQHLCNNVVIFGVETDGAFAEYAKVPEVCCWKLLKDTPYDLGAILEPLGVAVHSVLVDDVNSKSVAIFGCGPIGLFAIGAAAAFGAAKTFALEVVPKRLAMVGQLAPDAILINSKEQDPITTIMEATDGLGVDVVIELSGNSKATKQAFKLLRRGGRISLVGVPKVPIEINIYKDIINKEAKILGVWGRTMWQTWWQVQKLLSMGKFDPLSVVTHRFPLTDYAQAIDLAASHESGKILLYP